MEVVSPKKVPLLSCVSLTIVLASSPGDPAKLPLNVAATIALPLSHAVHALEGSHTSLLDSVLLVCIVPLYVPMCAT